jgi:hypothetical protein
MTTLELCRQNRFVREKFLRGVTALFHIRHGALLDLHPFHWKAFLAFDYPQWTGVAHYLREASFRDVSEEDCKKVVDDVYKVFENLEFGDEPTYHPPSLPDRADYFTMQEFIPLNDHRELALKIIELCQTHLHELFYPRKLIKRVQKCLRERTSFRGLTFASVLENDLEDSKCEKLADQIVHEAITQLFVVEKGDQARRIIPVSSTMLEKEDDRFNSRYHDTMKSLSKLLKEEDKEGTYKYSTDFDWFVHRKVRRYYEILRFIKEAYPDIKDPERLLDEAVKKHLGKSGDDRSVLLQAERVSMVAGRSQSFRPGVDQLFSRFSAARTRRCQALGDHREAINGAAK